MAPDGGDEPEKGDPGERNQIHADERDPTRIVLDVEIRDLRRCTPRCRPLPNEEHRDDEEKREDDPRHAGGPRRLEAEFGCDRLALTRRR